MNISLYANHGPTVLDSIRRFDALFWVDVDRCAHLVVLSVSRCAELRVESVRHCAELRV